MVVEDKGRFVKEGEGRELKKEIENYMEDKEMKKRWGENDMENVREEFKIKKEEDDIRRVYEKVLEGR